MLAWWACVAAPAGARQTGETAGGAANESDPIACWWRTDRAAVHVGERFTLTLTCSLLDTSDLRVVADRDRLDPAALDLTPFEVVGGTRHDDIQAPPRRYFQYSYTLRLFGEDRFGRDVDIPSVPVTYNIETSGVSATRGRDQLYLLPALPVRMLSLVPVTATDIQDASPDTFGDIDRRAVRATGELAAAGLFFTFAVALAGLAVVRVARPRLARGALGPGLLAPGEIVRGCVRDAERIKSEAGLTGWTTELVGQALTLLRIAAAVALGRTVAQRVVQRSIAADDGQLAVRKGALTVKRVLVSGATTPGAIDAALSRSIDPRVRFALEEIREAMRVFTAARYSRSGKLDRAALDASLDSAIAALRRLHEMHQWRSRTVDALSRATDRVKAVWDR
ncbi:MAG TPA: hypothetical protein VGJ78_25725 [Vicinamibacterales bacterium]|jgi:hypothetical protein